ncbi:MAG: NlpC/P60 family protein [Candidatus Limnocylindrales bacterium]
MAGRGDVARNTLSVAVLAFVVVATAMLPNAASAAVDEPALVVSIAEAQIGRSFRLGMEGPTRFDCSGLIYYVFSQAGLLDRIGGMRFTAREYYKWARELGLLAKTDPRVGDLSRHLFRRPSRHRAYAL